MNYLQIFRLSKKACRNLRPVFGIALALLQTRVLADTYYTVVTGDSLSEIAQKSLGSPVYGSKHGSLHKLLTVNKRIRDPDLIYPGQKIRINNNGEMIFEKDPRYSAPLAPPENAEVAAPEPPAETPAEKPVVVDDKPPPKEWDYRNTVGRLVFFYRPNYLDLRQTLASDGTRFRGEGWLFRDFVLYAGRNIGERTYLDGEVEYQDSHNLATGVDQFLVTTHSSDIIGADVGVSYRFALTDTLSLLPRLGVGINPTEVFHFISNTDLEVDQLGLLTGIASLTFAFPSRSILAALSARDSMYFQLEYQRHIPTRSKYDFSPGAMQQIETRLYYEQPLLRTPATLIYGIFAKHSWATFTENADRWSLSEWVYGATIGLGLNFFKNP